MDSKIDEILNKKMDRLQQVATKMPLIVLKGFPKSWLKSIGITKLVGVPLDIDLHQLNEEKPRLLQEVIVKTAEGQKEGYWCTYEEYAAIGDQILSLYFEIEIFKNNIFHNVFPCSYLVEGMDSLFANYFDNEEYVSEDDRHPSFTLFTEFYGGLKRIKDTYYITYIDESADQAFFEEMPDKMPIIEKSVYADTTFELSEEEDDFLLFIQNIIGHSQSNEIFISFSGDLHVLPNRYLERISVLQKIYEGQVAIHLISKAMDEKERIDEGDYLEILSRYWRYSSFRSLKMYKNINDPKNNKEVVLIPQSQIIDDIVKQAQLAKDGETYKDVFVTSPTGAGKSIMFQIPAVYLAEKYNLMTIVISPLIGLMKDQVEGMQRKQIDMSATINSEITPVEKMDIIEKIKEGKISILYISPETLLSRSDIKMLIGERQIGLFVVDEAHIVTTWGKAFRSDYWYLGSYLSKLRKEMDMENKGFPVATFTATAIYGGVEDMYSETRDSLNLINPISYFGYIKRDDIHVKIKQSKKEQDRYNEYLGDKFKIMLLRLEKHFLPKEEKTLIYFPTISLIHQFRDFVRASNSDIYHQIAMYYGTMSKEDKNESFLKYRSGEAKVMLATKAFGMGIDIPDITNVYHFAPTGNVCDYIQEIGRAARDLDEGKAYFDYLSKDFIHVNRLHGISTIKKQQLVQVIEKILKILEQNKDRQHARNLLVSAEDFRYIFERKSAIDQDDDIDNKLKTALLIIEKDFIAKMNYSPLVARPRSVFSKEYFLFEKQHEKNILQQFRPYFSLSRQRNTEENNIFGSIYVCDMKKLWEDKFQHMSFPKFKYMFHQKDEKLKLSFLKHIMPVMQLELELKEANASVFLSGLKRNIEKISDVFGKYARDNKYFSLTDLTRDLQKVIGKSKYFCENLAGIMMQSMDNYDRVQKRTANFYTRFLRYYEQRQAYTISSGYAAFMDWIVNETNNILGDPNTIKLSEVKYQTFLPKVNKTRIEKTFVLLGIIEALGILLYRVNGGDKPEIYIRINSKLQLDRVVKEPNRYNNVILENVYNRHQISVSMLMYLFEKEVETEEFWNYIEDYFLGKIPDEVFAKVRSRHSS
ncbi:DEAD/DEAH box helicase [Metabacillus idriensis]|uniref:DEAD/DEAH box helicase n=1 Tax=Metabacillus idriensis TaxID=324768 RepID=UPI003D2D1955